SSGQAGVIEKWHEAADRLVAAVGPALGLNAIPMAQALHATAHTASRERTVDMHAADPGWRDWWEKRQGLATRDISVHELARSSLARLADVNATTQACVALLREPALAHARKLDQRLADGDALGLLGGMPLAHKDLLHRTGHEVGYGMAQPAAVATFDAT